VPPGQYADPDNGEVRRTATILQRIGARRPVGPDQLHGALLGFNRINGPDLHQPKEAHCKRGVHRHHDASTLNGYLISRHIEALSSDLGSVANREDNDKGVEISGWM
jgi:hypothetical protein